MPGRWSVREFLCEMSVPHTVVPSGIATPPDRSVPIPFAEHQWAKVVTCVVDGEPVEAVVQAPLTVNLTRLLELAGGSEIRLAQEEELPRLFAEREAVAVPPFAPFYGQSVFVDVALASGATIVLDGKAQAEAICVRWADFCRSVRPIVGPFAGHPDDCVGAYRLSYRE